MIASRRGAVALLVAISAAVGACQLIVGIDDEGVARPSASVVDAGGDPCPKLHPPGPPSPAAVTGTDGPPLVFAVRSIGFERPGPTPLGFDLDDRCTGNPTSTASDSPCALAGGSLPDADGGIDNVTATLLHRMGELRGTSDAGDVIGRGTTANVANGRTTALIALFDYNGQANDDHVRVEVVSSPGLFTAGCDAGSDAQIGPVPAWDGCDRWSHAAHSRIAEDGSQWTAADAGSDGYVVDSVVVAKIEGLTFGLNGGELSLHDGVFQARIDRTREGFPRLTDGVLGTRVDAAGLFRLVEQSLEQTGTCVDPTTAGVVRLAVCAGRDLPLHRADDGRGRECDALSLGLSFEAEPARVAPVKGYPPPPACLPIDIACQ